MIADKYPFLANEKQNILGVEIVRLETKRATIPIVATSEAKPGRITVFWWSVENGRWENWSREVEGLRMSGRTMKDAASSEWSNRVAVAAGRGNAFIVYKRKVSLDKENSEEGLLMDRLEWDENSSTLLPKTEVPIKIPVGGLIPRFRRTGYYLWAGFDQRSNKLLILFQSITRLVHTGPRDRWAFHFDIPIHDYEYFNKTLKGYLERDVSKRIKSMIKNGILPRISNREIPEKTDLTLFSAQLNNLTIDFSNPNSWHCLGVDEGGYHFDALSEGGNLYCVYRKVPYALEIVDPERLSTEISEPQEITIPGDPNNDAIYAPLYTKKIVLPTDRPENLIDDESSISDIPGGEHPQIQKANPLVITCDRVKDGYMRVTPSTTGCGGIETPIQLTPQIRSFQKLYIRETRTEPQWIRNKLLEFKMQPRNLHPRNQNRYIFSSTTARYALLNGFTPIYMVDFVEGEPKEPDEASFLCHSQVCQSVAVRKYLLFPSDSVANAQLTHFQNIDINHRLIPSSLTPDADEENSQFEPFVVNSNTADNTLGGAFVVDRSMGRLGFYSYTDMGDGGCRVIYDEQLPPPDPIAVDSGRKTMDPTTVTGPHVGEDKSVIIEKDGWFPVKLPGYHVGVDANAVLASLVLLFFLEEEERDELLDRLKRDPVSPGSIGAGIQPILDSLVSIYKLLYPDEIQTDTIVINEDKAIYIEEQLAAFPNFLPSDMSLFDTLWRPYQQIVDKINDEDSVYTTIISHSVITLSKYQIEYFLEYPERDRVEIKILDFHDTEARFLAEDFGQGSIDYRFKIKYFCDEIQTRGPFSDLLTIESVETNLYYGRRFTPGILMSEQRPTSSLTVGSFAGSPNTLDPPKELLAEQASALCMNPVGNTQLVVPEDGVKVKTKITFSNLMFDLMISLLIGVGLAAIAAAVVALIAEAGVAAATPFGWWLALILIGIAIFLCTVVAPPLIRGKIEREIKSRLNDPDMKEDIDEMGLMTYAGEGLAEGLAQIIYEMEDIQLDEEGVRGRNRFRDQFWQMIFVQANKCIIQIRK